MTDPSARRNDTSLEAPLARAAYRSGYAVAGVFVLAGVAGIAAHLPGLGALAQPLSTWPRLRALDAVGMLAVGLAFWAFLRVRYSAAMAGSVIGTGMGTLALLAYLASFPLPWEGMTLASAVLLTTASVALLMTAARRRLLPEEAAIGIAGFILLAVSTTFVIARAAGVVDPMTDRLVAGESVQMAVASFLLGVCFVALVWSRGLLSGDSARWLPAALGIAGVVTVTVLWRALATRESDQLLALTRQAGDERRHVLMREIEVTGRSLRRAAEWAASSAPAAARQRDIQSLERDVPGLEAAGWLSAAGVPEAGSAPSFTGSGADAVVRAFASKNTSGGPLTDTIAYLPLDSGAQRFVILAATCPRAPCAGTMAAVMRTAELFRTTFPDSTRGYRSGIIGREGRLAGPPTWTAREARWTQWLPLDFGAVHLTLAVWPTQSTVARVRSALPALVLLMGYVVSALIAVTVLLAQRSLSGARGAERARIASALERSTDGIWEWDLMTGASAHTAGIWRYLGYDPEAIPPMRASWMAIVHPADAARLQHAVDRHLAGETSSFEAEYRVRGQDGRWHTIVDRGRVVDRTPSGQPARLLGIRADVTVTRTAQRAREAAERRFREIFDSGFQFQLLLDRGGLVLEVNQHALDESGVSAERVVGRAAWETLWWTGHTEAQEHLRTAASAALAGATQRYEDQVSGADGATIHLEIAVKPLLDETGAPTQLLVEARDLTARRRAEATLREVDTLTTMGRVAARVAHEINNPLAGIQSSFLLIKGAIPSSHPHFAYVGAIEREIARIAAVTRQLYETYRPEHDATGETAVATVLGDAVAFLEQVNRAAGVRVEMDLSRCPTVIALPSAMLRQIAYNLVQNAIEASPSGQTVHVRTIATNGHFELRVRDHGAGVPPEVRERIYEPFFSTKDGRISTGGMGLGLALVHRTVTAAGGKIAIEEVEGGGCEFVVTLPLTRIPEGA